ncbi:MAG: redoxin domain-containing protein [Acidobacteriota bacterium]
MSVELSTELPRLTADGWVPTPLGDLDGESGLALVFWSAVCSHCRRYDPYLKAFGSRFPVGLAVVGCRAGETMDDLERAAAGRNLTFPLLHDGDGDLARSWGARQTPTVFLLAQGEVVYRGAIDDFTYPDAPGHRAYLDDAVEALLAGQSAPIDSTAAFGCPTESIYYGKKSLFPDADAS